MLKTISVILIAISIITFACNVSFAAIGCTLNDPDRDIQALFPQSTGYKTDFITIQERGGEKLKKEVEAKELCIRR